MMRNLAPFIENTCLKLGIDESHGLKHSKETVRYAEALMNAMPDVSEEERHMATFVAALHDLCDSKYTDVHIAAQEIKCWLIHHQKWSQVCADALISIITSMSYSKLRRSVDSSGKPVFPEHGKWQRAYEIGRHADLLESYTVARCVLYDKQIYPKISDDEHWQRVNVLFEHRVFNYIKDGWITLPEAVQIALGLEKKARRCLAEKCMEWPML